MNHFSKQMHGYIQQLRQLSFDVQTLESRQLLAGNVVASIDAGGNLTIIGDNDSNEIEVNLTPSEVTVMGLNGTVVDDSGLIDSQVTGDITIDLKNGNNVLEMDGTTRGDFGNMTVKSGSGDDTLEIFDMSVAGRFSLNSGDGDDLVDIEGDSGQNATFTLGGGNDTATIDFSAGDFENNPKRTIKVSATSGNNTLTFDDLYASGKLSIKTGNGTDAIYGYSYGKYGATLNTGGGNDTIDHDMAAQKRSVSVITGSGDDSFSGELSCLYGSAKLSTSKGNDMITLDAVAKKLTVSTGSGNDTVEIDDLTFYGEGNPSGRISLSGGNDTLIAGLNVDILIKASGGGGTDRFEGDDSSLTLSSFEDIT